MAAENYHITTKTRIPCFGKLSCAGAFAFVVMSMGYANGPLQPVNTAQEPPTIHMALQLPKQQESIRVTLEGIFAWVELQNLDVLIRQEAVEEALQSSKVERSKVLPKVGVRVSQQREQYSLVGEGFNYPGATTEITPENRSDALIVAEAPLLDLKKLSDYTAAKLGYKASGHGFNNTLQTAFERAVQAYFTHLRNLKRLDVVSASMQRDNFLLDMAQERFKSRVATKLDLTRAEVRLAEDERDWLERSTQVTQSELALKRVLNLDLNAPLAVECLDTEAIEPYKLPELSMKQLLAARPDYQEAQCNLEKLQAERKSAGYEQLPTLTAFGNAGYADTDLFQSGQQKEWTIGLRLDLPLFEGGRIQANKLKADSGVRAQRYKIQDLEQTVGAQFKNYCDQVESRYKQIHIMQKKLDLARQELELAVERFKSGVADNRDVVDAQVSLATTSEELVDIIYLYNLSRLDLARVQGNVKAVLSEYKP